MHGRGKFWSVKNADVTNNYVHDNRGIGLWADTNNRGFLSENNYISDNDSVGILYETSYNAVIRDNVLVRNGLLNGPNNPTFPTGAVYISESGGDRRVESRHKGAIEIADNFLLDNWSGVVLWENPDRYCGSAANTSTGLCTLVDRGSVTVRSCNATNIADEPYYDDCRWKTQNVRVHDNEFVFDPSHIGLQCTFQHSCGVNSILSNYGTFPDWSPYKGRVVQRAITFRQDNRFFDNTYVGRWEFLPFEQGNLKNFAQWRRGPYRQDRSSTMRPRG